ncbi:MAG: hypothetical protein Q8P78_02585 [bacterium]|nr:hypothetical protein [bacterium]
MVDLLKPKETPKIQPETVEQEPVPSIEVEHGPNVEAKETQVEQPREQAKEQPEQSVLPSVSQHISPLKERVATPHTKSERLIEIEKIMSDGLSELYAALPPEAQAMIKLEGEKAANHIEKLIESGKAAGKKVLSILRDWLHKVPGVNAYFLEQESKRKTDKIMAMARKSRPDTYA